MRKDIKRLVGVLKAQGCTVQLTRNSHLKVRRDGAVIGMLPGTPSDWRSLKNSVAHLRRAGVTGI